MERLLCQEEQEKRHFSILAPMKLSSKTLIGRTEFVDFPDLGLRAIPAKIDTGAYTTSMHCQEIYELKEGGKKTLFFRPLDKTFGKIPEQEIASNRYNRRKIRNSFGQMEVRFVIKTSIVVGGKKFETEISLSDRTKLRYPVLLGRRVLSRGFIIDVCKRNAGEKRIKIKLEPIPNKSKPK